MNEMKLFDELYYYYYHSHLRSGDSSPSISAVFNICAICTLAMSQILLIPDALGLVDIFNFGSYHGVTPYMYATFAPFPVLITYYTYGKRYIKLRTRHKIYDKQKSKNIRLLFCISTVALAAITQFLCWFSNNYWNFH